MSEVTRLSFRICATCRHLEIVEQQREFPVIIDTEYIVFHCSILDWTTREDYLMAPIPAELPRPVDPLFDCPYWTPHSFEESAGSP